MKLIFGSGQIGPRTVGPLTTGPLTVGPGAQFATSSGRSGGPLFKGRQLSGAQFAFQSVDDGYN